jgi:glucokinase
MRGTAETVVRGGGPVFDVGVDNLAGTLLHAPNLPPKWFALISRDSLQRALDLPITLANDADAATVGEAHFGAGRGHLDVVYLTISTGVGAGALVGGRLMLPRYSAGEIGHTVVDRRAAATGAPATIEELGSGTAIGRAAAERGLASKGPEIGGLVRDGDPVAREIWGEAMFVAGLGAVALAHLYAPTVVIVGGGVGLNADLTLEPIVDALGRFGPVGPPAEVVAAALGDDPGLVGAAGWRAATGA